MIGMTPDEITLAVVTIFIVAVIGLALWLRR
jgi:hypothetical protein